MVVIAELSFAASGVMDAGAIVRVYLSRGGRDVARDLKVAARFGEGKQTFVARPNSMRTRIVSHATSNSHQL